jgi:hypothetical protein
VSRQLLTADRTTPTSTVPSEIFRRLPLPFELALAIGDALEAEVDETDVMSRIELRLRTRSALEAWLEGRMTTSEVVRALPPRRLPRDRSDR